MPFSGIQWGDTTVRDITDRALSGYELKKQPLLRPLVNIIHCHTGLATHTNIQTMSDNQYIKLHAHNIPVKWDVVWH